MPELPEVETIIRDLNKKIVGYQVVDFWSEWEKGIKGISLKKFQAGIGGRRILRVRRLGKNIFIDLSGGKTMYVHLKMTGHLLLKSQRNQKNFQFPISNFQINSKSKIHPHPNSLPSTGERDGNGTGKEKDYFEDRVNQYIRHRWTLKKEKDILLMEFSDLRKFGKIVLVDTDKIGELPEIKKLGIDAMDKKFTLKKFQEILSKKQKSKIGILLMDQYLIAGIGNIYRSEILFEAGVNPERKVGELVNTEIVLIYKQIVETLKKAIKMRGTSDSDYRDTMGKPGSFQKVLKVYNREGEKCLSRQALAKNKKCDNIVERIQMGQRSVFICKKCQK
ncbi:MAG: Formamidopyrimidine-DNA glycosylase [Candidatus Moranbacteria bacterium GW2011_GWE1_35_17]|nr:MAG: Formamidopyrimidine-DNA glycosylase [Candidatus Moranbacteria bacterium GW2011_GWE1_35_17]KKP72524.1 MAG: Formamidopyrimidine-DNA glycosylase [Candidatus Moranbacteria bacterium GW2011_GWE2_35_164]KKP84200.1 MAG: Formamidopyrimidine-DNA glycosylase [Candidatus Moranbacteria bacterium GW2011_GWF2_35_54]